MTASKFPKRPVQVKAKTRLWRKPIVGCGCLLPMLLIMFFVALGISGITERRQHDNLVATQQQHDALIARLKADPPKFTTPTVATTPQPVATPKTKPTECSLSKAAFLEASIRMNDADKNGDSEAYKKWAREMDKRADRSLEVCRCVDYPDADGCK